MPTSPAYKRHGRALAATAAMAIVFTGMTALPASAAAGVIVDGCGTNDTIDATGIASYATASGATITPISSALKDANGLVNLYSLAGVMTKQTDGSLALSSTVVFYDAQGQIVGVNGTATDAKCLYTKSTSDKPATPLSNGTIAAPVAVENSGANAGKPGGTITLNDLPGIDWVVTDGTTTKTYTHADMVNGSLDVTLTSANVTVEAKPVDGNYLVSPNPMTWSYTLDGYANTATPAAPVLHDVPGLAGDTLSGLATTGVTYYMSAATVTAAPGSSPDAQVYTQVTVAADGTFALPASPLNFKIWAVPATAGNRFADGDAYKVWSYTRNAITKIALPAVQWTDQDGTANDGFLIPTTAHVTFQYTDGTHSSPTTVAEGTFIKATGTVSIVATAENADYTLTYGGADQGSSYTYADHVLTSGVVVVPAEPSGVDGSWTNDTFTFPAAVTGVSYAFTITDELGNVRQGTVGTATAGKTFARDQWNTLGAGDTLDLTKTVTFVVTPSAATPYEMAPVDDSKAPWTQVFTVLLDVTAPAPTFTDTATGSEHVTAPATAGIMWQAVVVADGATATDIDQAFAGSGVTTTAAGAALDMTVADGSTVVVRAIAADGYRIANPATGQTYGEWTQDFASATELTPPAPTKDDQPGKDKDTFTIHAMSGIDWYVDGVKVAPEQLNVPQSTGGKASINIKAVPTPGSGYTILSSATSEWTLTFAINDVMPLDPTATDAPGTADDVIVIPSVAGVQYKINGTAVAPGTHHAAGDVTVTAEAMTGYVLATGAKTTWTFSFTGGAVTLDTPVVTRSAALGKTASIPFSWTAPANANGAVTYKVTYQERSIGDNGSYVYGTEQTAETATSATAWTLQGVQGKTYVVSVIATDAAGNGSDAGKTVIDIAKDVKNTNGTLAGTWKAFTNTNYFVGTGLYTMGRGASYTFKTGNTGRVQIFGTRNKYASNFRVYVDGVLKVTANPSLGTAGFRSALATVSGLTKTAHTVRIVNLATAGRPYLWLDATRETR